MISWIKKNFVFTPRTIMAFCVVILIIGIMRMDSCVDKLNYKSQIRGLDKEIVSLKGDIIEWHSRATTAIAEAREAEEEARKERVEKEKHKANEARLEEEKKGLRAKIAALPPTQVVVHTVEILRVEPEEITLQEQGVLFTLSAARMNLEFLEEFTLVKKQRGELQISLAKSEKSEAKLMEANAKKDIAIISKDKQLEGWLQTEVKWNEKFDLSEGRRKKARIKGRKEGSIVGGIIGGLIGFFLGR